MDDRCRVASIILLQASISSLFREEKEKIKRGVSLILLYTGRYRWT